MWSFAGVGQHEAAWGGFGLPWPASSSGYHNISPSSHSTFKIIFAQGAIDPVGERIYSLEQSEIAFRELAAGGHKVQYPICNTHYA